MEIWVLIRLSPSFVVLVLNRENGNALQRALPPLESNLHEESALK
jgi:hypothetical protein